ncbi:MAG: M48 family metallopeptidase [Acidobacteriota bacterium]
MNRTWFRFPFLFWLAAQCLFPLWAQTRIKPGFNLFSAEQDVEIGRKSAAEVERQLPLLERRSVERYISRVGKRLAREVQGPKFPYQFKVVNVSDINAFALPGGFMYINRGLIEAAENEAELAGVMGHEMAHVALRHGTNQASKAYLAQAGLGVLGGLLGGGQGSANQIIGSVGGFGLNAVFLKFSRGAEEQADVVGAQTLSKAGYDPMAMADFFQTLREQAGRDPGKLEQFFSSHPTPTHRAERIEEEIRLMGRRRPSAPVGGFKRIQSELRRLPRAPSMQDLVPKTGGPSTGDEKRPGETNRGPVEVRADPPSARLVQFEQRDRFFRIRYPSNWRPLESTSGSVTLAPEGGVVEQRRGEPNIVYGLMVSQFDPRGSDRPSSQGPFRGRDYLSRSSNALVSDLLRGNDYLRVQRRSSREELLDGAPALSVTLSGRSPVTDRGERVILFTRALPDDRLIYLLFILPEDRHHELDNLLRPILSSFSLNDHALPR